MKEQDRKDSDKKVYKELIISLEQNAAPSPEDYSLPVYFVQREAVPVAMEAGKLVIKLHNLRNSSTEEAMTVIKGSEGLISQMERLTTVLRRSLSENGNGHNGNGHNNGSIEKEDASKKAIVY